MKSFFQMLLFTLVLAVFFSQVTTAQQLNWRIDGNNNAADSRLGMNNNFDLIFETNNVDRGVLENDGDWGIGTLAPTAQLHINSGAAEDALRVQVNGSTKLLVDDAGGLSVGTSTAPPLNGLLVNGDAIMSSNLEVIGTINVGSVENIEDGGTFVIHVNSNISHETDNSDGLGSSGNRWIDLWAVDGTINTSDAREKSNVLDLTYGINDLMKLRPVSYMWTANPERGTKLGLIAQELQQVVPEVVRDWEYKTDETTGKKTVVPSERLGVMYDDLIPVLVKSIQDQQAVIAELENRLTALENANSKVSYTNEDIREKSFLDQNIPNPFSGSTTIRFQKDDDAKNVMIQITDLKGQIVKTLFPAGNEMIIQANELPAGTYYYSLIVDGVERGTKKMNIIY